MEVFSVAAETTTSGVPVGDATSTRQAEPVPVGDTEETTAVHRPQAAAPPAEDVAKAWKFSREKRRRRRGRP